jgi:hypothetical protein
MSWPTRLENKAVESPLPRNALLDNRAAAKQKSYSKKATRTPPRAVLGPFFTAAPRAAGHSPRTLGTPGSFGCDRKTFSAPRWTDRSTPALTKFHVLGAHSTLENQQ